MPHTLSDTQVLTLFKILEVPFYNSFVLSGYNSSAAENTIAAQGPQSAKTVILSHLDSINSDSVAKETLLKGWLTEFQSLARDVTELQNSSIGTTSNLTFSNRDLREEIRKDILTVVPYFKLHELLKKNHGVSSSIQGIR